MGVVYQQEGLGTVEEGIEPRARKGSKAKPAREEHPTSLTLTLRWSLPLLIGLSLV